LASVAETGLQLGMGAVGADRGIGFGQSAVVERHPRRVTFLGKAIGAVGGVRHTRRCALVRNSSIIPSFFEIKESRRRIFFPKRIGGDYFWGRICLKY
jgi:hypothetical protein